MSITDVATNSTPRTVVAQPYRRVESDNDDDLPKVAVKEPRRVLTDVPKPPNNINGNPGTDDETWKDRYSNLRSHAAKKENAYKKQLDELAAENARLKAQKQVNSLPKTADEVKAWAEQYPNSFDMIKTIAVSESQTQIEALQAQINQLRADNEQTSQEKAEAVLTSLVPTWRSLNKDVAFHNWLKVQTETVELRKNWADIVYNSSNPKAIAEVLNTYLESTKQQAPKPQFNSDRNVDAALGVNMPNNVEVNTNAEQDGYIRESDVKRLTRKQFEQYEEMIDKAIAEGRFIYDISGKAQ